MKKETPLPELIISNKLIGWVKIQRSLLNSPIIANPNLCQIYMWCCLRANHETKWVSLNTGKGYTDILCKRGQFITGRNKASEELSISKSTFRNRLKKIEEYGFIKLKSNNLYTVVTIVNYDCLENKVSKDKQASDKKIITKKQTTKNDVLENEQHNNTNNNEKKIKNKKKINKYELLVNEAIDKDYPKEIVKAYEEIISLINNCPNVMALEEALTIKEFIVLVDAFSYEQLEGIIFKMDNYTGLKKYSSVFKTAMSWLKRNHKNY